MPQEGSIPPPSLQELTVMHAVSAPAVVAEDVFFASPSSTPCALLLPLKSVPSSDRSATALKAAIAFCCLVMIAEFAGGIFTHSLAVMNDAVHMITDVGTLGLSLVAVHVAKWKSCHKFSYGWRRAEVVGALASVFATWFLVLWIVVEALSRLYVIVLCASEGYENDPQCFAIDAPVMLLIGVGGFFSNVACALILHWGGGNHGHSHGGLPMRRDHHDDNHDHHDDHLDTHDHEHHDHDHHDDEHHDHHHNDNHGHRDHGNMNVRGAFLHVLGDCLQSFGVVVSAAIIWYGNVQQCGSPSSAHSYANIADPLCSLLFGAITIFTTTRLFGDIFRVLMECTPSYVSTETLWVDLASIPRVEAVHDLHVWSLGSETVVMSAHMLLKASTSMVDADSILHEAERRCHKAGIDHSTIQLHFANHGAPQVAQEAQRSVDTDEPVLQ